MERALPPATLREKLPRFMQKCAQQFQADARYRDDPRYLRVWIQLVNALSPLHALQSSLWQGHHRFRALGAFTFQSGLASSICSGSVDILGAVQSFLLNLHWLSWHFGGGSGLPPESALVQLTFWGRFRVAS